ncbi:MAG: zf-HC2 domain-containing protein [Armatimonadetes bacterium]|nr:zf-HC2 domain-containing protein [Armatimonadota bacterium]
MTCRLVRKHISLYIDSQLDSRQRRQVEEHLEACASCRTCHQSLQSAVEALGCLERQEPRAGGWERLRYQLENESARSQPSPVWRLWKPVVAGVGGVALVAGVVLSLLHSRPVNMADSGQTPPSSSRSAVSAPSGLAPSLPHNQNRVASGAEDNSASAQDNPALAPAVSPDVAVKARANRRVARSPGSPAALRHNWRVARHPAGSTAYSEPDPAFAHDTVSEPASTTRDIAETVSTGMQPLLAAAEMDDPVSSLTDIRSEDWL